MRITFFRGKSNFVSEIMSFSAVSCQNRFVRGLKIPGCARATEKRALSLSLSSYVCLLSLFVCRVSPPPLHSVTHAQYNIQITKKLLLYCVNYRLHKCTLNFTPPPPSATKKRFVKYPVHFSFISLLFKRLFCLEKVT